MLIANCQPHTAQFWSLQSYLWKHHGQKHWKNRRRLTAGNVLCKGSQVLRTNMPARGFCSTANVEYNVAAAPCEIPPTTIRLQSIPRLFSSAMYDCTAMTTTQFTSLHQESQLILSNSEKARFFFTHFNSAMWLWTAAPWITRPFNEEKLPHHKGSDTELFRYKGEIFAWQKYMDAFMSPPMTA